MKIHDFTTSEHENKYYRVIFCRKCGKVAWNYNLFLEANQALQKAVGECIEQETKTL